MLTSELSFCVFQKEPVTEFMSNWSLWQWLWVPHPYLLWPHHCDAQQADFQLSAPASLLEGAGAFSSSWSALCSHVAGRNCGRINNPLSTAPSGCSSQPLTLGGWCINTLTLSPLGGTTEVWALQSSVRVSSGWAVTCLIMPSSLATSLPHFTSPLPHCATYSQIKYLHLNPYLGHASEEPLL